MINTHKSVTTFLPYNTVNKNEMFSSLDKKRENFIDVIFLDFFHVKLHNRHVLQVSSIISGRKQPKTIGRKLEFYG